MAREAHTRLPQPVFHEPNFGEDRSTPIRPGSRRSIRATMRYTTRSRSSLKKDVVSFRNRAAPTTICSSLSMSMAVMGRKSSRRSAMLERSSFMRSAIRRLQLPQVFQRTQGRRPGHHGLRPIGRREPPRFPLPPRRHRLQFRRISNISTTISSTSHSGTIRRRSSPSPATTTRSWSRAPLRHTRR